jgi:iduronate 2-sulfatase
MYDPSKIELPKEPPLAEQNYRSGSWYEDANRPATDADRREVMRAYFACSSYMDSQLGRVLDALDANKSWNDTIVILLSDHGFHLGEHANLAWGKSFNTEQATRSPLMISVPGMVPGNCSSLVELIDIYPTVLSLLKIPLDEPIDGLSLKPLLLDPTKTLKPAAISEYRKTGARWGGYSIRTVNRRYTKFARSRYGEVLIDHTTDPLELHNLAKKAPFSKEIKDLQALLPPELSLAQRVESRTPNPDRDADKTSDVDELRNGSNPRKSNATPSQRRPQ